REVGRAGDLCRGRADLAHPRSADRAPARARALAAPTAANGLQLRYLRPSTRTATGGFMKRAARAVRLCPAVPILVFLAHANAHPSVAAIDTALRTAVERGDVPGVVALVTDREHVLYRGAFGVADVSSKRPMAVDSMFRIASMTKAITSL